VQFLFPFLWNVAPRPWLIGGRRLQITTLPLNVGDPPSTESGDTSQKNENLIRSQFYIQHTPILKINLFEACVISVKVWDPLLLFQCKITNL